MDYEADDLDQARQHMRLGLELSRQPALAPFTMVVKKVLAQLQYVTGEIEAAMATIREAHQIAFQAGDTEDAALLAAIEADFQLRQGNLAAVELWAETADLTLTGAPDPARETCYFTYIRLLLAQDRPEEAQSLLTKLEHSARENGRYGRLITIHILQALTQQRLGNDAEALTHLEEALRLAAPEDYRRAFLDEGRNLARLLPKVRHVAPAFIDSLLEAKGHEALISDLQPQVPLVEPLNEREMEVLRLMAAGLSNREIADRLHLSINTIRWYAGSIYGKLGVSGRGKAVAYAQELGIL